jgi:hypothetical protein
MEQVSPPPNFPCTSIHPRSRRHSTTLSPKSRPRVRIDAVAAQVGEQRPRLRARGAEPVPAVPRHGRVRKVHLDEELVDQRQQRARAQMLDDRVFRALCVCGFVVWKVMMQVCGGRVEQVA